MKLELGVAYHALAGVVIRANRPLPFEIVRWKQRWRTECNKKKRGEKRKEKRKELSKTRRENEERRAKEAGRGVSADGR